MFITINFLKRGDLMSIRSKSGIRYANALEKYKATKERRRAWAIAHAPKPKNKKDK